MPKALDQQLANYFNGRKSFSRKELLNFYKTYEPNLKEETFNWRIFDLKKRNVIQPLSRNLFTIKGQPNYKPNIDTSLIRLNKAIITQFDELKYCIWATNWLNEFSQHQSSKQIIIIEVENDITESVFYSLKDRIKADIFLNPDERTTQLYVAESHNPLVLKRLITRSPITKQTVKKNPVFVPALEKILVDIFIEQDLFYYLQGNELVHIYKNAFKKYAINFTKMLSYAQRRGKQQQIKEFLHQYFPKITKDIIHV